MDRTEIIRETSREAYKKLIESGALVGWFYSVWKWLYHNGPATKNEVALGINNRASNNVSTRLRQLVNMHNVREVGKDKCRVSGNNILLFDVTQQGYRGELSKTRGKKRPIIQTVESCEECPLVSLIGEREVCGLDTDVSCTHLLGRPAGCKLVERDVVLRGK